MPRVPLADVKVIGCGRCGAGPVRSNETGGPRCAACGADLEDRDLAILGHTGRMNTLGFPEIGIVGWVHPELRQ